MTTAPATPPEPTRPPLLEPLVRRARWTLAAERAWPVLVLGAGLAGVFLAVSWLGLWVALPRPGRIGGLAVFAAGALLAAGLLIRALRVSRGDALARLDRDADRPHRPVSSLEDRPANAAHDPLTRALWALSRRTGEEALARLRLRAPRLDAAPHDPFALRAAVLLGLVAAGFVAGPRTEGLVAAAFDWRSRAGAATGYRVDAWVDPPAYTGRPPVVLLAAAGAPTGTRPGGAPVAVPVHATVVVRGAGAGRLEARAEGGLTPATPDQATPDQAAPERPKAAPPAAAGTERRFRLDGDGRLAITEDGAPVGSFAFKAVPDLPPTVALTAPPRPTDRGGLTLAYRIGDDYGVSGAEAAFSAPAMEGRPFVRSLVPAPKLALNLPPTPGGLGEGQTTGDLSDHPWAGATVTVVLSARDEGGNTGLSAPVRAVLPARPFHNPLARALVEQRRDLVFDPDHRDGIALALDALMIDPDRFGTSKAVYLGLYTARRRLEAARNDADLSGLADYLWQMALRIEDGDKSAAAQDLQAAAQALREALARNAPPDEIRRLTEDLQRKMDRLLAEMAQKAQTAQDRAPADPRARTVTPDQLRQMMRRMEDLARSGDTAEAQRMLDQLQAMLDNMRSARNDAGAQAQREMNRQMGALDKMMRDQQALRDKTFQRGQQASPQDDGKGGEEDGAQAGPDGGAPDAEDQAQAAPGDNGDAPETRQPDKDAGANQDLQSQQGGLRQSLGELRKRMRQLGLKGEQGLEDAEGAMKEAEGALGQGSSGNRRATEAQGRALQGLQQGANGLARQMAQAQGQGQGEQPGPAGEGGSSISQGNPGQDGTDPLGRERNGRGSMDSQGRTLSESVAERAQRVLQELRKRLGDPDRPSQEMDYLERLLRRY